MKEIAIINGMMLDQLRIFWNEQKEATNDLEHYEACWKIEDLRLTCCLFALDEYRKHDETEIIETDDNDFDFEETVKDKIAELEEAIIEHRMGRERIEAVIDYIKHGRRSNV